MLRAGAAVEAAAGGPCAAGSRVLADKPDVAAQAPLFSVSKSAASRVIDHVGPKLVLVPRKLFA